MKTIIKFAAILIISLFVTSCSNNHEMLTVINPDGSCCREFYSSVDSVFKSGNMDKNHNPFPIIIDSTWNISYPFDESQAFVRRNYQSVEELANTFKLKPSHSWSDLNIEYRFNKSFRWFYTYYDYSETYPKIETSFSPLNEFMEDDDIDFWFNGQPNLTSGMNGIEMKEYTEQLSDKYNQWLAYNYWIAMYEILVDHYEVFDLSVSKEDFVLMRDSLFHKIKFSDLINTENNAYIGKKMDELLVSNKFTSFFEAADSPITKFDDDFWNQKFMKYMEETFTFKLLMPGKTLKATNAINQNDTLIWRLTAYRMVSDSYTIQAQTRKANIWAFIVTGLFIVLAGVIVFYKKKNK
ncbi:hypothetical protein LJB98_02695 [Bacteroidales bacterium OttesenSCG-928-M11]|nr:hypothetical protein [Bacteroidales bacterium OttesenSCG-928-M11]